MGFSAGGMVTMGVVMDHDAASRPDFAAPIYGGGTNETKVPGDAPPALFILCADNDHLAAAGSSPAVLGVEGHRTSGRAAYLREGRPRLRHDAEGPAGGPMDRALRRLARPAGAVQFRLAGACDRFQPEPVSPGGRGRCILPIPGAARICTGDHAILPSLSARRPVTVKLGLCPT